MLELIENHEGSKRHDGSTAFGRGFIRDLESIAEILRGCVPPATVEFQENGEEGPCPVHGKLSVGDPGLAHQLVGRLGLVSSMTRVWSSKPAAVLVMVPLMVMVVVVAAVSVVLLI
jgi:hypothetical protein